MLEKHLYAFTLSEKDFFVNTPEPGEGTSQAGIVTAGRMLDTGDESRFN